MTSFIVIDRRRLLARTRFTTGILTGVAFAGILWDDVAFGALCLMAFVWLFLFIDTSAKIREMTIVDDEHLHDSDEEVRMKRS